MAALVKLAVPLARGPAVFILALVLVTAPSRAEPGRPVTGDEPAKGDPLLPPSEQPFDADPLGKGPDGAPRVSPPALSFPASGAAATDWRTRIDQVWGPSPWSTSQMLAMYDAVWTRFDQSFACFQGLEVDLPALRAAARAEIQTGVSRGRFVAIINHLALALRESHTAVNDPTVNFSRLGPGIPLFVVGGWGDNAFFGAGLTPMPDSSLLVYKSVPNHRLGLKPGDIVLGYGGVPWKRLYRDLLAAQLPLTGFWWGSSSSSWTHSMLMSAGLNWHLFDTIDVVKHASRDTVHLPVAPLSAPGVRLDCTEQLPIPGVPMPDYLGAGDLVSWGVVQGTQIGYVYVRAWVGNAGTEFREAIQILLTQYETTGLIIDFRTNYGGNMFLSYEGLRLLFGKEVSTIGFATRCNPGDHLSMCSDPNGDPSFYVIHGSAAADYAHPIAVLVGPGAISSGDQVANLFRYHPRARFFGRSTSTAFNAPRQGVGASPFVWRYAASDAYRLSAPGDYLTHDEFPVDEPVWLEPDDVARGLDTVVEAAIRWISNRAPVCDAALASVDGAAGSDHKLLRAAVEGVTDPDGDAIQITIDSVTQDEPLAGTGDGDTCPDAAIVDGAAWLRWERAGNGNGRVYMISFTARDGKGGESRGSVQACVPHDRGRGQDACVDDGQRYDAIAACAPENDGAAGGGGISTSLRVTPRTPGTMQLDYALPRAGNVELGVYDVAGRRVARWLREGQPAGDHVLEWRAAGLRPGVYFVMLRLDRELLARTAVFAR
jgi:hypothetical protein